MRLFYILAIAICFFFLGAGIAFSEEDAGGCGAGDDQFYDGYSVDETLDNESHPIIGATTDKACQQKYGEPFYKACGNNCYHEGYADCWNPTIGLICSHGLVGCPANKSATACYARGRCSCKNGKVSCY